MKEPKNPNHPKKGSRITVEPIRRIKDIQLVSKLLSDNPRNHLLFLMGINNGLRTGDLLKLRVKQIRHLKLGDTLTIIESKTGKENFLAVNKTVYKALIRYLRSVKPDDDDFVFKSRKSDGPLTIQAVNSLVKRWTREAKIKGNFGAHSLRKTFGYVQRKEYGVGFEVLAKRFNHSSPTITMRYLGIQDKEVKNILNNEIG
jgi:integrase